MDSGHWLCEVFREKRHDELGGWIIFILIVITTLVFLAGCDPAWGMEASWYSVSDLKRDGQWELTHGRTSSGQLFTDSGLTAASRDWPLGTKVKVTRTDTKASVVVLVNDRTAKRFKGKRIDLSKGAMLALGGEQALRKGLLKVEVTKYEP